MRKLYRKYEIKKTNGEPVDQNAQYFVLRIDTDPAARAALLTYAEEISNEEPEFATQLRAWVAKQIKPTQMPSTLP
jgi:hypothetical protein